MTTRAGRRANGEHEPLLERILTKGLWRVIVLVIATVVTVAILSRSSGGGVGSTTSPTPTAGDTAGLSGSRGPTSLLSPPPGGDVTVPRSRHIWLLILENKTFDQIVGNPAAPYLNDLISKGGLATRYQAVDHPSQPNYLALFSGSLQGVADDKPHDLNATTLADQVEAAGMTWHVYAENVPKGCSNVPTASGGVDGTGDYARKHEPAISFTSIRNDPARCAHITPLTGFDPGVADVTIIVPNLCNDMHDCSVAVGDSWLRTFVPKITGSSAYADGGMLFITWDEGADGTTPPNRVATIVSSPLVAPGTTSNVSHNHYSLLRTIQSALGLGCLANSCSANTLGELFTNPLPSPSG